MKAMLLAAGVGQRMLPLTLALPKPAIPVLGRALAVQILRRLGAQGVREAVLNLHHLPEVVRRVVGDGVSAGLPAVRYTHEETILGTAGGLRNAAPLLAGGGPIVVANADSLADSDLAALIRTHRRTEALATLLVLPWRLGYSAVEVDPDGRVVSLAGRPAPPADVSTERRVFTGLHVMEESLLDRIPPGEAHLVRDLWLGLIEEGRLATHLHDGCWWEFGSPRLYLEGSLELIGLSADCRRAVSEEFDPVRRLGDASAAVGPGAAADDSARLAGRVALGFACRVSEGATVEESVIMPEAWVGPGARLRRVVVAQGVEVPAGFAAEDAVVCADPGGDAVVPPGTRRVRGLLVSPLGTGPG